MFRYRLNIELIELSSKLANLKHLKDVKVSDEGVQLTHVREVGHEIPNLQISTRHFRDDEKIVVFRLQARLAQERTEKLAVETENNSLGEDALAVLQLTITRRNF